MRLRDKKAVKSPFAGKKSAPDEEQHRYGDRILKIIPKWRETRVPVEKLKPWTGLSKHARKFIVADVLLHVIRNKRSLSFIPPTGPEYQEMIAIMHGVEISPATAKRRFPKKKRIVCDWRQSRTEHMAARSRAYQDWCDANGQEPGYLYGSQQARIGRAPPESDFNHKWNR